MRILWIVNTIFPKPSKALGLEEPISGGWMYGLAEQLERNENIVLAIATTYTKKEQKELNISGITYFLLPTKNILLYDVNLEKAWRDIEAKFKPDIIHIHGTEYLPGLACMRCLPESNYLISIQGLVSVVSNYYLGDIDYWDIIRNITFRDIITRNSIFQAKKNLQKIGSLEKEYIQRSQHVTGRTSWDYAHTKSINFKVNYHFCNETLRDKFYSADKWSLTECRKHTIFLSQGDYPVKGLHQVIKILARLKKLYPDIIVRLGGNDVTKRRTFRDKVRLSGYGKYLKTLIRNKSVQDNIIFLGPLSELEMIEEYKNSHIFICPSSIENSPNSLGEAQLLGVPTISAYVGGIPDMVENGKTGFLYRFEEVEMLFEKIRMVFDNPDLADVLSINGIKAASLRHDRDINLLQLLSIYKKIQNRN